MMEELAGASVPAILVIMVVKVAFDALSAQKAKKAEVPLNGSRALLEDRVHRIDARSEQMEKQLAELTRSVSTMASSVGDLVEEMRTHRYTPLPPST